MKGTCCWPGPRERGHAWGGLGRGDGLHGAIRHHGSTGAAFTEAATLLCNNNVCDGKNMSECCRAEFERNERRSDEV